MWGRSITHKQKTSLVAVHVSRALTKQTGDSRNTKAQLPVLAGGRCVCVWIRPDSKSAGASSPSRLTQTPPLLAAHSRVDH